MISAASSNRVRAFLWVVIHFERRCRRQVAAQPKAEIEQREYRSLFLAAHLTELARMRRKASNTLSFRIDSHMLLHQTPMTGLPEFSHLHEALLATYMVQDESIP